MTNTNGDDLDQKTTAQLSELFAVEYAGFKRIETVDCGVIWNDAEGAVAVPRSYSRFAESADAVLPFVDWCEVKRLHAEPKWWRVRVACGSAVAPTLAHGLCLAMLRAARARKGPQ